MDPIIIAAMITGGAAVLTVIIRRVLTPRRKATLDPLRFEKSKALKLGFDVGAIQCILDVQGVVAPSTPELDALIIALNRELNLAIEIAKSLGISVGSPDANALIEDLLVQLELKPIAIKNTFKIGNIIGRLYFYAIPLMRSGFRPPSDDIEEKLQKAKQLLREAGLPSGLLRPIQRLWRTRLEGPYEDFDEQMEKVLNQLCQSIESGTRHSA